jgi:hypothetical protein
MFGGAKELKVIFFECDWFDPVNGTRVDDFGMVEVTHKLRYDAYVKRHDDDDVIHVYQEESEGHQSISLSVFDGAGLAELAARDVELMEEEPGPLTKRLQKSKWVAKNKKGMNDLMHGLLKQIQMLTTFNKYNLLLLYDNNHYIYEICC